MTHYILAGGPFDQACDFLLNEGFRIPYIEAAPLDETIKRADEKRRVSRAQSKTAFICPHCHPIVRVWGRPTLLIKCGICETDFVHDR